MLKLPVINFFSIAFILILESGCAATKLVDATDEQKMAQAKILTSLSIGQSMDDAVKTVPYPEEKRFTLLSESGKRYDYREVYNKETHIKMGLFFEDGQLVSLLMPPDIELFFACRTLFKTHGQHWLTSEFDNYRKWLIKKNRTDQHEYLKLSNPQNEPTAMRHGLDIVGYGPLFLLAGPAYLAAKASGEVDREKQQAQREAESQASGLSIAIGTNITDLKTRLGEPIATYENKPTRVLSYDHLGREGFEYGVRDDKVVSISTPSANELYQRQRSIMKLWDSMYDCTEIMTADIQTKSAVGWTK